MRFGLFFSSISSLAKWVTVNSMEPSHIEIENRKCKRKIIRMNRNGGNASTTHISCVCVCVYVWIYAKWSNMIWHFIGKTRVRHVSIVLSLSLFLGSIELACLVALATIRSYGSNTNFQLSLAKYVERVSFVLFESRISIRIDSIWLHWKRLNGTRLACTERNRNGFLLGVVQYG